MQRRSSMAVGQLLVNPRNARTHSKKQMLALDPRNPRRHSAQQIRQVARSIEAFGFAVPILVDRNNVIVAGHARYHAARLLGLNLVPVIRLGHLSEAQAKALRIADNRLTDTSTWDDRLLSETLKELSEAALDFNIEAIGFEIGEIDLRIEGLTQPGAVDDDKANSLPSAGPAVSQPSDLWLLGKHRLLCGSALDARSFNDLMDDQRAAMVFVDPPYNVPIDGHASGLGKIRYREFVMASGEKTNAEFATFIGSACTLLAGHSVAGAIHFVCMDWRHAEHLFAAGRLAYSERKNICVWTKHNAGMGSFYRSQHELIFVFKAGRGRHRNNVQLGQHGRNRSNVWSYPGANSFGQATDEGHLLALHPTIKPVRLVADAILDCSARGEIVLDSFLGSGTTVIAAERTGRRCFGMEIDPLYVDTAIRRWQTYTGESAKHAHTGLSFASVEEGLSHAAR